MRFEKYYCLLILLFISACQYTEKEQIVASQLEQEHQIAEQIVNSCEEPGHDVEYLFDCESAKAGTIPITHPVAEIVIPLAPAPAVLEIAEAEAEVVDMWQRISQQLTFQVTENRRVRNQRNWYLKHPTYMQRVANRAHPFLYLIVEEIEKQQMPLELALLPIVESAFDPFAYSHGRAAGMWQFIPGTGKRFGMKQTWWFDGRRDVLTSTKGAMSYLKYLHKMFDGNWLHALAAYNSGEGRVMKAIKKNKKLGKSTAFWDLDLPRETRAYVPKLLALADILTNKEKYNFSWPKIDNVKIVEVVDVGSQIDLALAADLAGLTIKELHALNPGFNRWATDPDGPFTLLLPVDRVEKFNLAIQQTENSQRLNWVRHKVKRGDSLLRLANKYHTTADIIMQVNELKSNVIQAGKHLVIPVALKSLASYTLSQDNRLASTQARKNGSYKLNHTVKRGDTMWDLSREYDVNLRQFAKWNAMAPTDTLRPGKKLVIWVNQVSTKQEKNAVMRTITYTVRNGDSLAKIAGKFNVQLSDIQRWNQIDPKKYIQPGQKLKIFVDVTST
ncbi:MAG: membrane-bound lytic murein transglycosylase D [Paraglaciecola sp.]